MEDQFEKPAEASGQRMRGGTNLLAPAPACRTCAGDRFVVVSLRAPVETPWMKSRGIKTSKGATIEEYAACPDCNSSCNTSRHGFRSPDSALVREYLKR